MNRFLLKVAMLLMFILAILGVWAALTMTFSASIWNLILGVCGIFFFFRALELVDKVNKLGAYSEDKDNAHPDKEHPMPKGPGQGPRFGGGNPEEEPDITELPDEE